MAKEKKWQFSSDQSRSEAAKNGRKGGKKSGEVRAFKKTFKEAALKWRESGGNAEAMINHLWEVFYENQNVRAAELIVSLCGEKPKEEVSIETNNVADILTASNRLFSGDKKKEEDKE